MKRKKHKDGLCPKCRNQTYTLFVDPKTFILMAQCVKCKTIWNFLESQADLMRRLL